MANDVPFLVAVGASAGGLEALTQLFAAAPPETGMAFVVVQHLSPDYKSMMVELLDQHTSLSVVRAEDGLVPRAEHVYVIEPQTSIRLEGAALRITPMPRREHVPRPIDVFFESVAADRAGACAGVILSGTGSDGAHGCVALKDAGGVVVVQDPASAAFDGMPQAALRTHTPDMVLRPETIIPTLIESADQPRSDFGLSGTHGAPVLAQIEHTLRRHTGVNFAHYKSTTVLRRISRRMERLGLEDPHEYADRVADDPTELASLYQDLLIGVTRFFRDGGAIRSLQSVALPRLLATPTNAPLRIWVAGCSTGEEAYSLAMLITDALAASALEREFRIFATDVDAGALEVASAGEYSAEAVHALPPDLVDRYFVRKASTFVVHRRIRDRILFSRHNVVEDPPFSRLDMISCRNLLIYLQPNIQQRTLQLFSNALLDEGILWLGSSESLGDTAPLFKTLDSRWRIYATRPGRRRSVSPPFSRTYPAPARLPVSDGRSAQLLGALRAALGDYAPPTVIVNESFEVVYRYGDLSELLLVPTGAVSLDVRAMLPERLGALVSTAVSRALKRTEDVLYRSVVATTVSGEGRQFDLRARAAPESPNANQLVALIFEELNPAPANATVVEGDSLQSELERELRRTQQELAETRATLHATIEELESANEELQSTNEELTAANEELQSTNEELQSVNEELRMVNDEHHAKVTELVELNRTLDLVLNNVDVGLIIVDQSLVLSRFNPAASRFFNVRHVDVGRPLSHLTHRLAFHDLLDRTNEVIRTGEPLRRQVNTLDGQSSLLLSIRPRGGESAGALMAITDVTTLVRAERDASQLKAAFEYAGMAVAILDGEGRIDAVSASFAHRLGRDPRYLEGVDIRDLIDPSSVAHVDGGLSAATIGEAWSGVVCSRLPDGSRRWDLVDLGRSADFTLWIATSLQSALRHGLELHGDVAYWIWDPVADTTYNTHNVNELWGLPRDTPVTNQGRRAVLTSEEMALIDAGVAEAFEHDQATVVRVPRRGLQLTLQRVELENGKTVLMGETRRVREEPSS